MFFIIRSFAMAYINVKVCPFACNMWIRSLERAAIFLKNSDLSRKPTLHRNNSNPSLSWFDININNDQLILATLCKVCAKPSYIFSLVFSSICKLFFIMLARVLFLKNKQVGSMWSQMTQNVTLNDFFFKTTYILINISKLVIYKKKIFHRW